MQDFGFWMWVSLPILAGVGVLIAWLGDGAKEPYERGWEVSLPLVTLIPIWGAVATQWNAARNPAAKREVRRWENFPGTAYAMMAVVVVSWSVMCVRPDKLGSFASPRVKGSVISDCSDGSIKRSETANDVAQITFNSSADLYIRYHNCWECQPQRIAGAHSTFHVSTAHGMDFSLSEDGSQKLSKVLGDQGVYNLEVAEDGKQLVMTTVHHPWPSAAPLSVSLAILVVLWGLHFLANKLVETRCDEIDDDDVPGHQLLPGGVEKSEKPTAAPGRPGQRLLALDVFRGGSLVIMNVANYGGCGYWWLNHSTWDGLTIADLVFPWFIWIMGVAMAVALEGSRVRADRCGAVIHVCRRASILFLVAMWLDGDTAFKVVRVPGVLQRFAISYLVCGAAIIGVPKAPVQQPTQDHVQEPEAAERVWRWAGPCLREAPIFVGLAAVWLAVSLGTTAAAEPDTGDCPTGYLGPGGISQGGKHFGCTGGIARWLDHKVFGTHVYSGCFPCLTYMKFDAVQNTCRMPPRHDPEGLLGALNSIVLCWLGVVVGRIVREARGAAATPAMLKSTTASLLAIGCTLCLAAGGLCGFQQFGVGIPVNKNLWSLSFICVMSGTGTLVLTALLWAIDWRKLWSGKPFLFVGMNSILYYCMHELFDNFIPLNMSANALGGNGGTKQVQTARVTIAVITNVTVVYWLWRNKLFLKV